jgi:TM2 domain-containing membrane protein YozV
MTIVSSSPFDSNTHSIPIGYLYWILGFTGAHRFYYGRPITGTLWFFTLGLLGVGWIADAFFIPWMDKAADRTYVEGTYNYNIAWGLLTFFGVLGLHRFYLGKWVTGIVWLLTGGFFLMGYLYDLWTLNEQVAAANTI